jgi:hypothetical protein
MPLTGVAKTASIIVVRCPNNTNRLSRTIKEIFVLALICMDHDMVFTLGCGQQQSRQCKKYTYFAGNFDCHGDVTVQFGEHRPMEHIPGFTRSHRMLPSGKCLGPIAPAAAMVDNFE